MLYQSNEPEVALHRRAYTVSLAATFAKNERAQQIIKARDAGMTLAQIAEIQSISRERVRQILASFGLVAENSGRKRILVARKEAERAEITFKRDKRCIKVYGCSYSALESVLGNDIGLTTSTTAKAYLQHKKNAKRRGIGFEMTFLQWWSVWQQSGKWLERAKGTGYVMARKGDIGPYAINNVYICTQSQNSKDSFLKTPSSIRNAKSAVNSSAKSRLGSGRGWSFDKKSKKNPYRVMLGRNYIGSFPTEQEARVAYIAACEEKRKQLAALLSAQETT